MQNRQRVRAETFNDGICMIYLVTNSALTGKKPVEVLTAKYIGLRYRERTVGMSRYYTAKQTNTRVDRLLRMQSLRDVTIQDVVMTEDGIHYAIRQIQYPEDVEPPVMDLTLERVTEQ